VRDTHEAGRHATPNRDLTPTSVPGVMLPHWRMAARPGLEMRAWPRRWRGWRARPGPVERLGRRWRLVLRRTLDGLLARPRWGGQADCCGLLSVGNLMLWSWWWLRNG